MKKITRQRTKIYSRIVGYITPIDNWNPGKLAEFRDRKFFKIPLDEENKYKV